MIAFVSESTRLVGRYCSHETWNELMSHRELALAKRHTREHEKWKEHKRQLPALQVGEPNRPRRWERTRTVVEVR